MRWKIKRKQNKIDIERVCKEKSKIEDGNYHSIMIAYFWLYFIHRSRIERKNEVFMLLKFHIPLVRYLKAE